MLYTVRPLERIYTDFRSNEKDNRMTNSKDAKVEEELKEEILPHGRIVTRRDGENLIIDRINSTDMHDYLNKEYSPGSIMKK